jgi:hypothetical protein
MVLFAFYGAHVEEGSSFYVVTCSVAELEICGFIKIKNKKYEK